MIIRKSDSDSYDIVVIARMSPVQNARTRRLIRALAHDFKVRAISESPDGSRRKGSIDGVKLDEIPLPLPRLHVWYLTGWLRVVYFNCAAAYLALKSNASAVVCSDSIYYLAGIIFKLILQRKFVYNSHEIMWGLGNPPFVSGLLGKLEKFAIQICDFWLVPSEERAAIILKKHGLNKSFVVYENLPIIDNTSSEPITSRPGPALVGSSKHKPIVMFQGSVTKDRGLEQLIGAAKRGNFQLFIQGKGPLLNGFRMAGTEYVTFLEPCSNKDAVAWLSLADLSFVFYENTCLNSAYACSSKFYASVFAGIPIICNRLPSFQAFAEKYGGVAFFERIEPEAIETCIMKALTPSTYHRLKHEIGSAKRVLASIPLEQKISTAFYKLFETNSI